MRKKELESKIRSRRGKQLFRKDMRAYELCQRESLLLTRRHIHDLGPWTRKMCEHVLNETGDFNSLLKKLRGTEIHQPELFHLFFLSRAYNRLADMSYEVF